MSYVVAPHGLPRHEFMKVHTCDEAGSACRFAYVCCAQGMEKTWSKVVGVSTDWLDACEQQLQCVDVDSSLLYRPILHPIPFKRMSGYDVDLVVALTNFEDPEKSGLFPHSLLLATLATHTHTHTHTHQQC